MNDVHAAGAASGDGVVQQIEATRSHIAGDERARIAHGCSHGDRLAARRCAEIEDPFSRTSVHDKGHELRRFILDEERLVLGGAQRIA